jgi:ribosomal protein L13
MLPKGVLGREYYRRLYIYSDNKINFKKIKSISSIPLSEAEENNWITVNL